MTQLLPRLATGLALTTWMALGACGSSKPAQQPGDPQPTATPARKVKSTFLWRVSHPAHPGWGGHLLGLAYVLPREFASLDKAIWNAFDRSERLLLEPSATVGMAAAHFGTAMVGALTHGTKPEAPTLPADVKAAARKRFAELDLDQAQGEASLPAAALVAVEALRAQQLGLYEDLGMPAQLQARAASRSLTVEDVTSAFGLAHAELASPVRAEDVVKAAVRDPPGILAAQRLMGTGDEEAVRRAADAGWLLFQDGGALLAAFAKARASKLLPAIEEALKDARPPLLGVAPEHLAGAGGVVALLRANGWVVEPVAPAGPTPTGPVDTWSQVRDPSRWFSASMPGTVTRRTEESSWTAQSSVGGQVFLAASYVMAAEDMAGKTTQQLAEAVADKALKLDGKGASGVHAEVGADGNVQVSAEVEGVRITGRIVIRGRYASMLASAHGVHAAPDDARHWRTRRFLDSMGVPPPATPRAAPPAPVGDGQDLFVQGTLVNLRKAPEANSELVVRLGIGTLCRSSQVPPQKGFLAVTCGAHQGWLKSDLLGATMPDLAGLLATAGNTELEPSERVLAASRAAALDPSSVEAGRAFEAAFLDQEFARIHPATSLRVLRCRSDSTPQDCLRGVMYLGPADGPVWERVVVREDSFVHMLRTREGRFALRSGTIRRNAALRWSYRVTGSRLGELGVDQWRALTGNPALEPAPEAAASSWHVAAEVGTPPGGWVQPLDGGRALLSAETKVMPGDEHSVAQSSGQLTVLDSRGAVESTFALPADAMVAAAGDAVLVSTGTGVKALDLRGQHRWQSSIQGLPRHAATTEHRTFVCVQAPDAPTMSLHALDRATGKVAWSRELQACQGMEVSGSEVRVWATESVRRFRAEDGAEAWGAMQLPPRWAAPVDQYAKERRQGGRVLVQGPESIYAVHGGSEEAGAWEAQLPRKDWDASAYDVGLLFTDTDVLACANDVVALLDRETGLSKALVGVAGAGCASLVAAGQPDALWVGGRNRLFLLQRRAGVAPENAVVTGTVRLKGKPARGATVSVGPRLQQFEGITNNKGMYRIPVTATGVFAVDQTLWNEAPVTAGVRVPPLLRLNGAGNYRVDLTLEEMDEGEAPSDN